MVHELFDTAALLMQGTNLTEVYIVHELLDMASL